MRFMKKLIEKMDSSLLDVDPVMEYLEKFQDYEVVEEDIQKDNGEINLQKGEEFIRIVFLNMSSAKWWSVYRYHLDGTKYEQIDTLLYNEHRDDDGDKYNRIIKYSGHIEDEVYSYITCSGFSYLDDEVVSSWIENRVVPIEDLSKIHYCKNMNLTELIGMTDEKSSHIIKKESLTNAKTLRLSIEKSIL